MRGSLANHRRKQRAMRGHASPCVLNTVTIRVQSSVMPQETRAAFSRYRREALAWSALFVLLFRFSDS